MPAFEPNCCKGFIKKSLSRFSYMLTYKREQTEVKVQSIQ
jgi:hypothetical protein